MPYFNLHTHHPALAADCIEVESIYFGQARATASPWCSVGLHPWYLEGVDLAEAEAWLREEGRRPSTLAIGEAGLDKVCATPWDLQMQAFRLCVDISEQMEKPLVLHCVRAYAETLACRKEWKARQAWIYHGFNKNMPTAQMLLRAGCYLSFGKDLFNKNSHAAECLSAVPKGRFFLETDDAALTIKEIYERAAALRSVSLQELTDALLGEAGGLFRFHG